MREKENARLAQGSFIHRLIEEALLEFNSLRADGAPSTQAADAAPLDAELFVDAASPPGLPAVQHGNLAALEDDDAPVVPQRRRVMLGIAALLLVLAAAALAFLAT